MVISEYPHTVVQPGVMISLCSTVYRRGYQLRAAMGPNLAHLRRHWRYTRWVVALCKDDRGGARDREDLALEEWTRQHYRQFIDAGLPNGSPSGLSAEAWFEGKTGPGRGIAT